MAPLIVSVFPWDAKPHESIVVTLYMQCKSHSLLLTGQVESHYQVTTERPLL